MEFLSSCPLLLYFKLNSAHNNATFASSGGDRTAFVWDVTTGETIRRFAGHMGRINAVELNADASVLASGMARLALH